MHSQAAVGGGKDFGEHRQQKDGLDHHYDGNGARQMGQGQVPENRDGAGTVQARGFFCSWSRDCMAVIRIRIAKGIATTQ